jgi:hypothetical protein
MARAQTLPSLCGPPPSSLSRQPCRKFFYYNFFVSQVSAASNNFLWKDNSLNMSSRPFALWCLKVPPGGTKTPGYDDVEGFPCPYRITMAAIDSSLSSSKPSTLKIYRKVVTIVADDDDDDGGDADEEEESREDETIVCTLESGKVCKFLPDCLDLMEDVPTTTGHHYPRGRRGLLLSFR